MRDTIFKVATCAVLGLSSSLFAVDHISEAGEITEEWLLELGHETGYTEHIRHFNSVFKTMNVRTFLEFGVGFSTKYFIDNSKEVISVEFVTPGSGPEWLQYCIDLYRNCDTWTPIAYFSGDGLDTSWAPYKYLGDTSVYLAAAYQPVYYQSYAPIDPSFLEDLNHFVEIQAENNDIDVAFVDAGVCIRGDLVQVLFNKVPIIAAHDISPKELRGKNDVYGYGRIKVPENYEEVYIRPGMGTAFWIKKEAAYSEVLKSLQRYAEKVNSKESN